MPIGDGPRDHPLLKDLHLGPLGNGVARQPTGHLDAAVRRASAGGGLGRGESLKVGGRDLTPQTPETAEVPCVRQIDGRIGVGVRAAGRTRGGADDLLVRRQAVRRRWPLAADWTRN